MITMLALGACGGTSEEDSFVKISDPGQVVTIDMLHASSFKESKEYSLEGLPGATYVSYGFFKTGNRDAYDFEIRFYESHQQAIDLGTALAVEGSGKDAILDEREATYKEGVKNRRTIIGGGAGGGARSGIGPRFGGYAIFGNIVMLCEGNDEEQSIEHCSLLANELIPAG